MGLNLYAHNAKAYKSVLAMMQQYGKAAIVHPTGTGKSYIAFKLIEDHPEAAILWLSPSEYIFKTQLDSLKMQDVNLSLANVTFYTYAKLMCCTEDQLAEIAAQHPAYIILDEFHRIGAEYWGKGVTDLLKLCPDAKLLGLTATNVRYLDNNRDMAEELFEGHVASEMTLGEAIVRGILPAPKYVTTVYRYQNELARYQQRVDNLHSVGIQDINQKYLDALRRALEQADGLDKVFAKHIAKPDGKYIVFCAGKEHMDEMQTHVPEWFGGIAANGVHVYKAYSSDPATSYEFEAFKADTSPALKLLFCIDMLNEGVHIEEISGVILFRPTISPIVYKQQIGRALTAGDSKTPLILDIVNNFEGLCSIAGLQNEMTQAVQRLYANSEGDRIVTDRFEIIEQVRDCRILFEQLQRSLSSTWDHYYAQASVYYAEHGNLNVPVSYTTTDGLSLGSWLQIQRFVRAGKRAGTLTQQQIDRLDSIGIEWDGRLDLAWKRAFALAEAYYREHGNLLVPNRYKTTDGFALGQWVGVRRQKYLDGELTADQIKQLESIGMVWDAVSARWEKAYAEAAVYYAENGDLETPTKYVTPSGVALGSWLSSQRRLHQDGKLSTDKIARLEKIGMDWSDRHDRSWQKYYAAARQYYQSHANLDIPAGYVTVDGITLGKWLARLRRIYEKSGTTTRALSDTRKAMLDHLGMKWPEQQPNRKTA